MKISFIITTYNVSPYIEKCLESLRDTVTPGDQVILVDDGSTDGTVELITAFAELGFGPDVEWTPVFLGVNTIGGVGIAGNLGLDHVQRETVFFVDGDDYLIPEVFWEARRRYEAAPTDIYFTDYLEYDEKGQKTKSPADAARWPSTLRAASLEEKRLAALKLIAVPWRKFYRTAFLQEHNLRYPEGDFFFEDNPFHWQVCIAARSIGFSQLVVCHHRVNRPGQTMVSTGLELAAFFTHFETIMGIVQDGEPEHRRQAARWVLGNMSWHIGRLAPGAFYVYARKAAAALQRISDADWETVSGEMLTSPTWQAADQLRRGGIWDVVTFWRSERWHRESLNLLRDIKKHASSLESQVKVSREILQAQKAVEQFEALKTLLSETPHVPKSKTASS